MEIREIIRHIREERSDRQIRKDLGVDRRTVKRYRTWAQEQGLLKGELLDRPQKDWIRDHLFDDLVAQIQLRIEAESKQP